MKSIKLLSLLFIVSITFSACKGEKKNTKDTDNNLLVGEIKIDGSSTVYPITEAVAESFREIQPKVKVTVGVSGTGGGFKKFSRGETHISDASRPIKEKEVKACKEQGITYVPLSVAYDGLAVVINPKNDWVDSFTVEELKKLWEPDAQEKVTKWSHIREGWPDEEIHLFGPGTASGTYDYFAGAICGKKVGTRGDYTASEDDNVLVQGIANDKYGLGFFGLAYFEENKDKLALVGVDNGKGAIIPTMETVSNGTYAPLSRPIFIYVSNTAYEKPELVEFVNYYLKHAGELSAEVGYIPLPKEEYAKQTEAFKQFMSAKQ